MFSPDKFVQSRLKGGRVYPQLDCFGIVNEIRRDLCMPLWPGFCRGHQRRRRTRPGSAPDDAFPESVVNPAKGRGGLLFRVDRHPCGDCGQYRWPAACGGMQSPGTNVTFLPLPRFKRRFVKVEFWR